MVSYSKKIATGSAIIIFFYVLSTAFGYLQKTIFARTLTLENIGLFFSVVGFIKFFEFLRDWGLSESLVYFIPRFMVKKANVKIKSSIVFTTLIQFISGTLFLVLMIFLSGLISQIYFKNSLAQFLLITLSIYFVIDGINEVLYRSFISYQNMFLSESITFSFQLISNVLLISMALAGISVKFFGFSYIIASALTVIVFSYIFVKKVFPLFIKTKTLITKKFGRDLLSYSIHGMIGTVGDKVYGQQSIFFLTLFAGLESVSFYVMARTIAKAPNILFSAVKKAFSPIISELWEKKSLKKLNYYVEKILVVSFSFSIPFLMAIFVFSEEALFILFGDNFLPAANLLKLFSLYFIISTFIGPFKALFLNTGKPKIQRNFTYVVLFVNLLFNIILIPMFGVLGAGYADLISILAGLGFVILMVKKNIEFFKIPLVSTLKILVASGIYVSVIYLLKSIITAPVLIEMFVVVGISSLVYVALLLLFKVLTIKESLDLLNKVKEK